MEAAKKLLRSPVTTIVLFALAVALLLVSTIGGARAALTYFSENYVSRVSMFDIGVTLVENNRDVGWRDYVGQEDYLWNEYTGMLLLGMVPEGETLLLGNAYPEELAAKNSGTIDEFVRMTIYRYWVDENNDKRVDLEPDLIDIQLANLDTDWILDETATTDERIVLYYNKVLPAGATTPPCTSAITISGDVASQVTQTTHEADGYSYVTITYDYNGARYQLEAVVDAVQTHNAENAIWSAWGIRTNYSGGVLTLS